MATKKKYCCETCGKELPEDHLIVGKKHYCDIGCVPAPVESGKMSESEKEYKNKCIDFWKERYENPNLPMLIRQAKVMFDEFKNVGFNWKLLYNVICYMEVYERPYDTKFTLRQIDSYIYPCLKFVQKLGTSKRTVLVNNDVKARRTVKRVIRFKDLDEEGWEI